MSPLRQAAVVRFTRHAGDEDSDTTYLAVAAFAVVDLCRDLALVIVRHNVDLSR